MSSLRGRYRRSKKASTNPYAGRGLDKFALVSAELEAQRENLAAQLDTPLSMVKFALGSHNKWIPIILSRSTKKGIKKKSTVMVPEDKLALESRTQKDGVDDYEDRIHAIGVIDEKEAHLGSDSNSIDEEQSGAINGNRAYLGGIIEEQRTQLSGDLIHKDKTTLGGLLDFQRDDLGEIVEILSASSEGEHIAAYDGQANGLQAHNAKNSMGAAWVVNKASTVFLRWHAKSMAKNTSSAERSPLPKAKILHKSHTPDTASVSSSPSPLKKTPASSPFQAELLPLPSPPARIKTSSNGNQAAIEEVMEDTSMSPKGSFKQHRKSKAQCFLKMRSAPSTPRDSRQAQKPFTAASALPKTHGLNDQAAHTDVKEERLIVHKAISQQNTLSTSRLARVSTAEKAQKKRARRVGQALAATGLLLSLSGLIMGYVSAIFVVVCWWYLLPTLRKAAGDKPVVRSHHHSRDSNNNYSTIKPLNAQPKSKKVIKEAGSGKYDLQSQEYKKKVIMEGFLDRGRRSNS